MMYIQSPFEENLQNILRNHVSRSENTIQTVLLGATQKEGGTEINVNGGASANAAIQRPYIFQPQHYQKTSQTEAEKNGEYPLFDIIYSSEEEEEEEDDDEGSIAATSVAASDCVITKKELKNHLSNEINFKVVEASEGEETQEEDFEYIVYKVPNSKKQRIHSNIKLRRPVPAAIPIDSFNIGSIRRKRVLNGELPNYNQHHNLNEKPTTYILRNDGEDSPQILPTNNLSSQMGFDLKNLLRKLVPKSFTNHDHPSDNRKRRSENILSDANYPHNFKYRKVESKFPKILTQKFEEDNYELNSYSAMNNCHKYQEQPSTSRGYLEMNRNHATNSFGKPVQRKSLFSTPSTVHKIVKNTSYADCEFSDDDEPLVVKDYRSKAKTTKASSELGNVRNHSSSCDIPTTKLQRTYASVLSARPPSSSPPPLIEKRCNNILAPVLGGDKNVKRRSKLIDLYENGSLGEFIYSGPTDNLLPSVRSNTVKNISAHGQTTTSATTNTVGLHKNKINSSVYRNNSMLSREIRNEEREKYLQLLERMEPDVYVSEENVFKVPNKNNYNDVTRRRNSQFATVPSANKAYFTADAKIFNANARNASSLSHRRSVLSSTINLDDDDDDDDDVKFTGIAKLSRHRRTPNGPGPVIIDDDSLSDIINLDTDDENKYKSKKEKINNVDSKSNNKLPYVEPVNSLQERYNLIPVLKHNWLDKWDTKFDQLKKLHQQEVIEIEKETAEKTAERVAAEIEMQHRFRDFQIIDPELIVIDDFPEPIEDDVPEFIELNSEQEATIKSAIYGKPSQVLISKFNLNISRHDIHTLLDQNWLNDEVINFYMNLLTERSEIREASESLPKVYAMNTFFIPRLLQAGHSGVKRWTRKVDIFAKEVIPVPVHVGGVHWCMAIIHLRNRTIKYYDSMGSPNANVLKALEQYLKDESMDKRKQPFDTSEFEIESVRDVPRQMNGSDCGVFSCMFAEYITRNKEITFTQEHMPYFRNKMILEIAQGQLLH